MTDRRAPYRLTGRITVALPPREAFRLFTPRGEQDWVPGWRPFFPVRTPDDTAPGTVFQTHSHGETTTWVVTDCEPGRRIRYTRVTPSARAGVVTVDVAGVGDNSNVTVTYELTALTDAGEGELRDFAARYPAFLRSWQDAIAARSS